MQELSIPGILILMLTIILILKYLPRYRIEVFGPYVVTVDDHIPLEQMMGYYDLVHPDVQQLSLGVVEREKKGPQEIEFYLVYFPDKILTTTQVTKELERRGYYQASFRGLLTFGIKHPDKQRSHFITTLSDDLCMGWSLLFDEYPYLYHDQNRQRVLNVREVELDKNGYALPIPCYPYKDWGDVYQFLVYK